MSPIRVGVLTVSDRCASAEMEDLSGAAIVSLLTPPYYRVGSCAIVPDNRKSISRTLRRWSDEFFCDVILTTGGTGLAERDVTPEATRRVIDREVGGLSIYLLSESLKTTPYAALGRGIAGVRGRTLIVNLPGSPSGARECTERLLPLLAHAVGLLRGEPVDHNDASRPGS